MGPLRIRTRNHGAVRPAFPQGGRVDAGPGQTTFAAMYRGDGRENGQSFDIHGFGVLQRFSQAQRASKNSRVLVDDGKTGDIPKTSLSVYRPPGAEPFGREAVELLGKITPHVRRAIRLHWQIHDLEHNLATQTEVLEYLTVGIALHR